MRVRHAVISLLLLLFPVTALAQVEVRAPGRQTIPLAVTAPVSLDPGETSAVAEEFDKVLQWDLELSGLFSLVDPAAFLSDARKLGLISVDVDFAQWRLLGAESLVKAGYSVRGDELVIEARLYDVIGRRLLTGRRYSGKVGEVRRMAHAFVDQILKELTGHAGPFNTRIAFISNRSGHKELYLMDVDGHRPQQLTEHRSIVLSPDFSPSGRELLFTSYKAGSADLYRKEIFGAESVVSSRGGLNITGRFRPGGRELALTLSQDGNSELYLLGIDGSLRQRLTRDWGIDVEPSWSPKGDEIAFTSDRQGNPHLFILQIADRAVRRLTTAGRYNVNPDWSPRGDRIVFSRMEEGRFDLYTIAPDGSDERRLTFGPGNKEHPRWSPDGRFIVYSSTEAGKKAIHLMRADGTGGRRISPAGGESQHPAWSSQW